MAVARVSGPVFIALGLSAGSFAFC